jgi:Serine kinase of the HPr protein, regulates carbohydrate metabolism
MTGSAAPFARQSGCVAIGGRGILIEGAPGTGKSALALSLIDRGARLVADDGVMILPAGDRLVASPHPRTRGLMEIRNLGVLNFPCEDEAPLALAIVLDPAAPRYVEAAQGMELGGIVLPALHIWPHDGLSALKAELGLKTFGLRF